MKTTTRTKHETNTPLLALLRSATPDQRQRLADLAGTSVNYLYQLASGSRGSRLTVTLAFKIEDATRTLRAETGGAKSGLPVIAARDLADMGSNPEN